MEPGSLKSYYEHALEAEKFLNAYYCSKSEIPFAHENLRFPMEKFRQVFSKVEFKGKSLTDISIGNIIDYLNEAKNNFNRITIAKTTDVCVVEAKKSLDSQTGALNSSRTSTPAAGLAVTSDQEDKESGRKTASIDVVKLNLSQENPTYPLVLPQADCLVINTILGVISRDLEDLGGNLGIFSKLLKPGGYLLYCGYLNATFYAIGGVRVQVVKYNESDLKSILSKEGFVINNIEVFEAKAKTDVSDFDAAVFCIARKKPTP